MEIPYPRIELSQAYMEVMANTINVVKLTQIEEEIKELSVPDTCDPEVAGKFIEKLRSEIWLTDKDAWAVYVTAAGL